MKYRGMTSKGAKFRAFDSWNVQTVYMPNGKTMPQYCGSYFSGKRLYTCLQKPRISSNGIHHVPPAQKKIVNPLRNGTTSFNSGHVGAAIINRAPANVVIATAPMLIQ